MILTINLSGKIPSKKDQQRILKSHRTGRPFIKASAAHDTWAQTTAWALRAQAPRGVVLPLQRAQRITATLYFGDERRRDSGNVWDSLADILVDAGILKDDNWRCTGEVRLVPVLRPKEPGAKIEIEFEGGAGK